MRARRWTLVLLLVALVASGLGIVAAMTPAQAKTVPDARCGTTNLGSGLCVADARGTTYWLGTQHGYDGVELYCLDYQYSTRWGVQHRRVLVTQGLTSSLGSKVGASTVAALTYLVTRYPAEEADDTTAAAIGLIIRQVMGDVRRGTTQVIPSGLTVASAVRDVGFVPDEVVDRAGALWIEARDHRGPWSLSVTLEKGTDGRVTLGERVVARVQAQTASGAPQDATVRLGYTAFAGPASVRLGSDGLARVALTAPAQPTVGSVTAAITLAPSPHPVVVFPTDWTVNRQPGSASPITQRGLMGRQSRVTARASAKATIIKVTPVVRTVASAQQVKPGATIYDTVKVFGTRGATTSFRWALVGPVPRTSSGGCPGPGSASWRTAKTIVAGTVAVRGDGTYRTPTYVVRTQDVGCLTYGEQLAGTATTQQVTSPRGVAEETVLVTRLKSNPCLRTVASLQQGLVGSELHDRVYVGCISGPDRVRVTWTAHGPVAPTEVGAAGCDSIQASTWRSAPVRAHGSFVAGKAGTYRTTPFTVTRPGCYTFSGSIAATATTNAASSPPGIAIETVIITRPPIPSVPVVPTGPYRVASDGLARTATYAGRVRIGGLGLDAPVTKVGVVDAVMAIPKDPGILGWLRSTAQAADVIGSSVVAGHVTSASGRPGALHSLVRVRTGMTVVWTDEKGAAHRFVVADVRKLPRGQALPRAVFRNDGPHVLRLVTCTDRVQRAEGSYFYANNLVVTARAVS